MANRATPYGTRYTGWYKDDVNTQMAFYLNGTLVMTVAGNDLTLADKLTVDGTSALTGVVTVGGEYALPRARTWQSPFLAAMISYGVVTTTR